MYPTVILAGGQATRLCHKALLPISNKRIMIESAIDAVRRAGPRGFNEVAYIIVAKDSIIPSVLMMRGHYIRFGKQENSGIIHAMMAGFILMAPATNVRFLFCDNIYDFVEFQDNDNSASVIESVNESLDVWDHKNHMWCHRSEQGSVRFAGYVNVNYTLFSQAVKSIENFDSLVQLFNEMKTSAHSLIENRGVWQDLGTEESYRSYLRANSY